MAEILGLNFPRSNYFGKFGEDNVHLYQYALRAFHYHDTYTQNRKVLEHVDAATSELSDLSLCHTYITHLSRLSRGAVKHQFRNV